MSESFESKWQQQLRADLLVWCNEYLSQPVVNDGDLRYRFTVADVRDLIRMVRFVRLIQPAGLFEVKSLNRETMKSLAEYVRELNDFVGTYRANGEAGSLYSGVDKWLTQEKFLQSEIYNEFIRLSYGDGQALK